MRLIADQNAEEKINEFEDITIEIIQSATENGKNLKIRELQRTVGQYQPTNVHVIGVPEGKRKIGRKNSLRNNDKFSNYDENYKFIEAQ